MNREDVQVGQRVVRPTWGDPPGTVFKVVAVHRKLIEIECVSGGRYPCKPGARTRLVPSLLTLELQETGT